MLLQYITFTMVFRSRPDSVDLSSSTYPAGRCLDHVTLPSTSSNLFGLNSSTLHIPSSIYLTLSSSLRSLFCLLSFSRSASSTTGLWPHSILIDARSWSDVRQPHARLNSAYLVVCSHSWTPLLWHNHHLPPVFISDGYISIYTPAFIPARCTCINPVHTTRPTSPLANHVVIIRTDWANECRHCM